MNRYNRLAQETAFAFNGDDAEFLESLQFYMITILRDEPRVKRLNYPSKLTHNRIEMFYEVCMTRLYLDLPLSLTTDERFKPYFREYNLLLMLINLTPDCFFTEDEKVAYKEQVEMKAMEHKIRIG